MSKKERDKGVAGEREVATILRNSGAVIRSLEASGDHLVVSELENGPDLHLEVKRQERIQIELWCRQAEAECPPGCIPIVVWRRSRQPWRVTLTLEDLIRLLG